MTFPIQPNREPDQDERDAFVAGFICAGGDAIEGEKQAGQFMTLMRFHRAEKKLS